jgi:hypothetical protein
MSQSTRGHIWRRLFLYDTPVLRWAIFASVIGVMSARAYGLNMIANMLCYEDSVGLFGGEVPSHFVA